MMIRAATSAPSPVSPLVRRRLLPLATAGPYERAPTFPGSRAGVAASQRPAAALGDHAQPAVAVALQLQLGPALVVELRGALAEQVLQPVGGVAAVEPQRHGARLRAEVVH